MPTTTVALTEADVLADVLAGGEATLSPDAAHWLLSLGLTEAQKRRMEELADKGNRGTLAPVERDELEQYVRAADILSILHARARLDLDASDPRSD